MPLTSCIKFRTDGGLRVFQVGGLCDGVDLNRNYAFAWANGPLCASAINCLPTCESNRTRRPLAAPPPPSVTVTVTVHFGLARTADRRSALPAGTDHGLSPNSEPEVRATVAFMDAIAAQHSSVLGAIDWHSYSQLILRPYGCEYAADFLALQYCSSACMFRDCLQFQCLRGCPLPADTCPPWGEDTPANDAQHERVGAAMARP